jgi:hypothetical protein
MASDITRKDVKVRENRLRRAAERQGFKLHKSRRRDPQQWAYGGYWLTNAANGDVIRLWNTEGLPNFGVTLDVIETFLKMSRTEKWLVDPRLEVDPLHGRRHLRGGG